MQAMCLLSDIIDKTDGDLSGRLSAERLRPVEQRAVRPMQGSQAADMTK
jgi:hypothetical protein